MIAKKYLVLPADQSVAASAARVIVAPDEAAAINAYLLNVIAVDSEFRNHVLDRSVNISFAERFFLQTEEEKEHHGQDLPVDTEDEIIFNRVRAYFEDRPDLGKWYANYLATGDADGLSEDIFTFVALREGRAHEEIMAVDLDTIPVISA